MKLQARRGLYRCSDQVGTDRLQRPDILRRVCEAGIFPADVHSKCGYPNRDNQQLRYLKCKCYRLVFVLHLVTPKENAPRSARVNPLGLVLVERPGGHRRCNRYPEYRIAPGDREHFSVGCQYQTAAGQAGPT